MSSLATERAHLIQDISDRAALVVAEINPGISCVKQRQFAIPAVIIDEVWKGRANISGQPNPPDAERAELKVTEVNLSRFLSTREPLPTITVVELELQPACHEAGTARFWNYGVRLGFAHDPEHLLYGVGFKQPRSLGGLDMIIRPVTYTELQIPISVADLRAFRDFLQYSQLVRPG